MRFSRTALTILLFGSLWHEATWATAQQRWSKDWEEMMEVTQPSEKIMDAVGIKPGMRVAEVGAGNGRLAARLARRVGESGRVYANDIDPKALEFMRMRVQNESISNMIVVEGQPIDPCLPQGALDAVVLANTLHMVDEPVPLLKNIIRSLRAGGILVLLEADRDKLLAQQNEHMASMVLPKADYLKWLVEAGYELVGEHSFLPRHFLLIFRVKEPTGGLAIQRRWR